MGLLDRLIDLLGGDGGGEPSSSGDGPPGGITCKEALERLYEHLDGELPAPECASVERHLEICERCYPRLAFEKSFREAVERAREGRRAPPEVRERVLSVLEDDGEPGGDAPGG